MPPKELGVQQDHADIPPKELGVQQDHADMPPRGTILAQFDTERPTRNKVRKLDKILPNWLICELLHQLRMSIKRS